MDGYYKGTCLQCGIHYFCLTICGSGCQNHFFPSHIFNSTTKIRDLWDLGVVRLVPGKPLAEDGVSLDESVDCGMYRLPPEPASRAMLLFSSIKLPSTKLLFRIN